MAVISTDPIYVEPALGSTIDEGRWGRGDFSDPVFITDTSTGITNTVGRWGRGDFSDPVFPSDTATGITNTVGRWGRGDFMSATNSYLIAPVGTRQYTYRGRVGGEYVYSTGSPPSGATDVIIVGGLKG